MFRVFFIFIYPFVCILHLKPPLMSLLHHIKEKTQNLAQNSLCPPTPVHHPHVEWHQAISLTNHTSFSFNPWLCIKHSILRWTVSLTFLAWKWPFDFNANFDFNACLWSGLHLRLAVYVNIVFTFNCGTICILYCLHVFISCIHILLVVHTCSSFCFMLTCLIVELCKLKFPCCGPLTY